MLRNSIAQFFRPLVAIPVTPRCSWMKFMGSLANADRSLMVSYPQKVASLQNKVDLLVRQLAGCTSTGALCQDGFVRIYPYCRIPGRPRQRAAETTSP